MEINTDKMVDTLKKDKPLHGGMVLDERGNDKLFCLFALPRLYPQIEAFAKNLLEKEANKK